MERVVFWLAVCFSCVLGAFVAAYALCKVGDKLRALRRAGWACVLAAVVAVIHGGSKNIIQRFSSDGGIEVTSAVMDIATNDVDQTFLTYSYTGTNDVSLPLWVRQSVSNDWEHLGQEWVFDSRVYENGTNTCHYFVDPPASNIVPFAMYYVGNDPPPVEIVESGGVEILSFCMTSKAVTITYAVDGTVLRGKPGTLHVERSETDNVWIDLYTTNHADTVTNTLTGTGFFVGRTTKWRVRMEVEQ